MSRIRNLWRDERGQMGLMFVLSLVGLLTFFALALDAGIWAFDHRWAQNQAEAAALAAAGALPASDTAAATAAADAWLARNGAAPGDRSCLDYFDRTGDGRADTVRVCARRQSSGIFSILSIPYVWISASATAMAGPVDVANVMPWGVVPPDPTCNTPGELCQDNAPGQPTQNCGYYPPVPPGEHLCPWGLDADKLYPFKVSGTITPGNFGALRACGNGATNYRDCITGEVVSGFWEEGTDVMVETETGNMGANTNTALNDRYPSSTWATCDVHSTPLASMPLLNPTRGRDPDGKAAAVTTFVTGPNAGVCADRLVIIPIIDHFPVGGADPIHVIGIATFGIARWDRTAAYGNALGTDLAECGTGSGASAFECGQVWGYLMEGAQPPNILLQRIGDTDNPFAPILIALVD